MRANGSRGFVGSDRLDEDAAEVRREQLMPVRNTFGQKLRFGLITADLSRIAAMLTAGEPLRIISSYPQTTRVYFSSSIIEYVSGGIEGELIDRESEVDAGFELIQSGDSVQQNGLAIAEDDIALVYIEKINPQATTACITEENMPE